MARLDPLPRDAVTELDDDFAFFERTLGFVPNSLLTGHDNDCPRCLFTCNTELHTLRSYSHRRMPMGPHAVSSSTILLVERSGLHNSVLTGHILLDLRDLRDLRDLLRLYLT